QVRRRRRGRRRRGRRRAQTTGDGRLQIVRKSFQTPGELARRHREGVEGDIGRNGRRQTDGRGEQGFGDGRGDGRQIGVARRRDAVEGVHDAPYRAEQADEG